MREPLLDTASVKDNVGTGVKIVLARRSPAAWDRRQEPVTFGIPLPRGAAHDPATVSLYNSDQRAVPTQARALDRWSDGSVRWLLVDAQVDAGFGSADEYFLRTGQDNTAPHVDVRDDNGTLIVSTGAAEFHLRSETSFPFHDVLAGDRPAIDAKSSAITAEDESGVCPVTIRRLTIEEAGHLRTVIVAEGDVRRPNGEVLLQLLLRMHFFAASPVVRMLVTVRNTRRAAHPNGFWDLGDAGSIYLKDLSLRIAMPRVAGEPIVWCSPEANAPFEQVTGPLSIYQDSSGGDNWKSRNHLNRNRRVPTTFRGYRLQSGSGATEGLRATPIVVLERESCCLAATMPHFWQNFPKAMEATEDALTIRLLPSHSADLHEIQGGEQKTHEVFVAFARDGITAEPLEWCRSRLVPRADPSWYFSSGAIPYLTSHDAEADGPRVELTQAAIEGRDTFEHKRELIDQYGWRHFGEIYGDHEAVRQPGLVSHYNNQYDPILGFARQFLSSGDVRWWTQLEELASHVVDIDIYHTDQDKSAYNHGLFWHTFHYGDADTATHRTYPRSAAGRTSGGGPSGEHNYTSGLALYHFMSGEMTACETAVSLAQFVIDADDGSKTVFKWLDRGFTGYPTASASSAYHGPGRGSGNSLNALLDAFRLTGNRRFIDKAEQVIRRCIHPEDDIAAMELLDAERRWFYTMFLQALGKYLDEKAEGGALDAMYAYGRASLLHYARWMADHEAPYLDHPERLEFPTETWAAQDIRKSDVFYYAMQHTSGPERERFRERGQFFYRYATETLRRMRTHTLARPIIVLMTSGVLHAWFDAQPDLQAPSGPRHAAFGKPSPFVAQRTRAVRRAKAIAATAAVLGLGAIGSLVLFGAW